MMRASICACTAVCFVALGVTTACGSSATQSGVSGAAGSAASAGTSSGVGGTGGTTSGGSGSHTGGSTSNTGGSTAGGGGANGGASTGGAAHHVGQCDNLGAVGVWEDIVPPVIDQSTKPLMITAVADPNNAGTVYTSGSPMNCCGSYGIFRSTDCGANWTKVDTGRNAKQIESGSQWQMTIDPTDSQVLYASNGYGGPPSLFKSTNGGTDWDPLFPDGGSVASQIGGNFVQEFSMDPTDSKHLVVSFHFNCTGTYAPMCMGETKDGGATWRIFKGPTQGWEEGAGPIVLGPTSWLYSAIFAGVYYTKDSGATWEKVAGGGGHQMYRASSGTLFLGCNSGMCTSTDGHTWKSISGSPNASGVIGDGVNVFAVFQNDFSGQPFYEAKETDPSKWTRIQTPNMTQGASFLSYDSDHHILYAPTWQGGHLWRVVTR